MLSFSAFLFRLPSSLDMKQIENKILFYFSLGICRFNFNFKSKSNDVRQTTKCSVRNIYKTATAIPLHVIWCSKHDSRTLCDILMFAFASSLFWMQAAPWKCIESIVCIVEKWQHFLLDFGKKNEKFMHTNMKCTHRSFSHSLPLSHRLACSIE